MGMSYEPRLPNYATMRRAMSRLSTGQDVGYIPCPHPQCRGTLRPVDNEMTCTICASDESPFPTTERTN